MAKEISHKYFGITLNDDGSLKYNLGNWSDAGWYWDGDSSDHTVLMFLYRLGHSSVLKDFEAEMQNNPEIKQALEALVAREAKDPEALELYAYAATGDNQMWHFGGFGDAVASEGDNILYELKQHGELNGRVVVADDREAVAEVITEKFNDIYIDRANNEEKAIQKEAAEKLRDFELTFDSVLYDENKDDIDEWLYERIDNFANDLFWEVVNELTALPADDPNHIEFKEPLRQQPTKPDEQQTNVFDMGADKKKGASGSRGNGSQNSNKRPAMGKTGTAAGKGTPAEGLPEICASRLQATGQPIMIKRGESGYWPQADTFNPELFNEEHGITPAQEEAMVAGSMWGWGAPAADPKLYETDPKWKKLADDRAEERRKRKGVTNNNKVVTMGKTGEAVQKITAAMAKPKTETKAEKVRRLRAEAEQRAKTRASGKGATAAPETDENGTAVVGNAPEGDGAAAPAKPGAPTQPATGAKPATDQRPAEPAQPQPAAQGDKEDAATVLVRVNEKIQEIENRAKVDDAVKKELVDIRNTLTGVTASVKKAARADTLSDEQLRTVVAFLEKADRAYETTMKGFEAKAGMGAAIGTEASRIRTTVDAELQKAHETLLAYKEGKASVRGVEAAVMRLRSGIEQWNVLQRSVTAFRSESKTVQGSRGHLRDVVAVVAGLFDNGQISSGDELGQRMMEYFDMAPETFKGVRAFLSKEGKMPQSVPAVQSMAAGSDVRDLETIFSQ